MFGANLYNMPTRLLCSLNTPSMSSHKTVLNILCGLCYRCVLERTLTTIVKSCFSAKNTLTYFLCKKIIRAKTTLSCIIYVERKTCNHGSFVEALDGVHKLSQPRLFVSSSVALLFPDSYIFKQRQTYVCNMFHWQILTAFHVTLYHHLILSCSLEQLV